MKEESNINFWQKVAFLYGPFMKNSHKLYENNLQADKAGSEPGYGCSGAGMRFRSAFFYAGPICETLGSYGFLRKDD